MGLHEREVACRHHTVRRVGPQRPEQLGTERPVVVELCRGRLLFAKVGEQRHLGVGILIAVGEGNVNAVHLDAIRSQQFALFNVQPRVHEHSK